MKEAPKKSEGSTSEPKDPKKDKDQPPKPPSPDEWPDPPPPAPGWQQQARFVPDEEPAPCIHMGKELATSEIKNHVVGDQWVCACGQVFVVTINAGDKKVLTPIEETDA